MIKPTGSSTWNQNTIEHKETFIMLLLNRANKVLGITTISERGLSGTVTDVRMIYQFALKANASGIIIAITILQEIPTQVRAI
jgi:DNA repair protein RadC